MPLAYWAVDRIPFLRTEICESKSTGRVLDRRGSGSFLASIRGRPAVRHCILAKEEVGADLSKCDVGLCLADIVPGGQGQAV